MWLDLVVLELRLLLIQEMGQFMHGEHLRMKLIFGLGVLWGGLVDYLLLVVGTVLGRGLGWVLYMSQM